MASGLQGISFETRGLRLRDNRRERPGVLINRTQVSPNGRNLRARDIEGLSPEQIQKLGRQVDAIRDLSALGKQAPLSGLGDVLELKVDNIVWQIVLLRRDTLDTLIPGGAESLLGKETGLPRRSDLFEFSWVQLKWDNKAHNFPVALELEAYFSKLWLGLSLPDIKVAKAILTLTKEVAKANAQKLDAAVEIDDIRSDITAGQMDRKSGEEEIADITARLNAGLTLDYLKARVPIGFGAISSLPCPINDIVIKGGGSYEGQNPANDITWTNKSSEMSYSYIPMGAVVALVRQKA